MAGLAGVARPRPRAGRALLVAALLLPLPVLVGLEYGYWASQHREPALRDYNFHQHRFAFAILSSDRPLRGDDPELSALVRQGRRDFAAARRLLAEAPHWQLALIHYPHAVWSLKAWRPHGPDDAALAPAINALAARRGVSYPDLVRAVARRADRVEYAAHALRHYAAFWLAWSDLSPAARARWDDYARRFAPELAAPPRLRNYPLPFPLPRLAMLLALAVTVLAGGWAVRRRLRRGGRSLAAAQPPPELTAAAVCAVAAHGLLAATALTAFAHERFLMPALPLLLVCALLTAGAVNRKLGGLTTAGGLTVRQRDESFTGTPGGTARRSRRGRLWSASVRR